MTLGFVVVVALMTGGAFSTAHHCEAGDIWAGVDDARLAALAPSTHELIGEARRHQGSPLASVGRNPMVTQVKG